MLDIVRKSALILGTPRTKRRWPYIRYGGGILAHTGIVAHRKQEVAAVVASLSSNRAWIA